MTGHPQSVRPRNGLGTASLVLAIAGLALCWSIVGGVIGGAVAVILGFVGRGRASRGEADNGSVALAGIGLGFLAVAVSVVFVMIWGNAFRDAGGSEYLNCVSKAGTDQQALDGCMNGFLDRVETKFSVAPVTPTR